MMELKTKIVLLLILITISVLADAKEPRKSEVNKNDGGVNSISSPIVDIGMVAREQVGSVDNKDGLKNHGNRKSVVRASANMFFVEQSFITGIAIVLAIIGAGILTVAFVTRPREKMNMLLNDSYIPKQRNTGRDFVESSKAGIEKSELTKMNQPNVYEASGLIEKNKNDNLTDVARKLGVGTGELKLAIHLKEIQEKNQYEEVAI